MRDCSDSRWVSRLEAFGQPLRHRTVPVPTASGTEVVLRVRAAGICHTDLHIYDGWYDLGGGNRLSLSSRGVVLPRVLGHEIVGVVDAVGPDTDGPRRDRCHLVYPWIGCGTCSVCRSDREYLCDAPAVLGVQRDGGYSSHVVVPHPRYLIEIGDLEPTRAAALACSGLTAYSALCKFPGLDGTPIVVIGAGGVGLAAVDQARAAGAEVLVVDVNSDALAAAVAHGARWTVDARADDAADRVVSAIGQRAAAILDVVGSSDTAALTLACLSKGGTAVVVGLLGGRAEWPLPLLALTSVTLRGSFVGGLQELRRLVELTREGSIPAPSVTTLPFDSAAEAHQRLRNGTARGRQVLDASMPPVGAGAANLSQEVGA